MTRSRSRRRGIYLLPNTMTTVNIFFGFYATIKCIQSVAGDEVQFSKAGAAILIAAFFDAIDGRLARMTNTTTQFGLEYDALADLTSFCMAPAILVYTWGLSSFGRLGWLAAFLFFACGALRLARFNSDSVARDKNFFRGLPSPAAAILLSTTVMLHENLDSAVQPDKLYLVFVTYGLALLMVSNFRFRSFKGLDLKKPFSFSIMIFLLFSLIIIVSEPILSLFMLLALYTVGGLIESLMPEVLQIRLSDFLTRHQIHSPLQPVPDDDQSSTDSERESA